MNKRPVRLLGNVSMRGWRIRYYAIDFKNDDIDAKENNMDLGVLLSDCAFIWCREMGAKRVGY